MNATSVVDYALGQKIGEGGEGAVYRVLNQPHLAAKIYHKSVSAAMQAKLKVMAGVRPNTLCAWPTEFLSDGGRVKGFTMALIENFRPIHDLFGPSSRKHYFPHATWKFLITVAYNLAAAIHEIHRVGIVIGDVSSANIVVNPQGDVAFIDCDSYQIGNYLCPVGTPGYTPPELLRVNLSKTPRAANADRFGMAVLIFQLLMQGRHPFGGVHNDKANMTLEEAISDFRYAYSGVNSTTRQPKGTMLMSNLSSDVQELFLKAFERGSETGTRPTALEWAYGLHDMLMRLMQCQTNATHWHLPGPCQWCSAESYSMSHSGLSTHTGQFTMPSSAAALQSSSSASSQIGITRMTQQALVYTPLIPPSAPNPLLSAKQATFKPYYNWGRRIWAAAMLAGLGILIGLGFMIKHTLLSRTFYWVASGLLFVWIVWMLI